MRVRTPGWNMIASQEAEVRNALLSRPQAQKELVETLGTTDRRVGYILNQLHADGEIYYADGKWYIHDFVLATEGGMNENAREDEKTQL